MPNRVQTLRSSVPGNMPQAGTRQAGELWLNFADAHIGYIDAALNPQKLLAVRLFANTAPYATGDFVVYAGALYQATVPSAAGAFVTANWTKIGTAQDLSQYLPLAGGTLSGPVIAAADPIVNLGLATKQYVDGRSSAASTTAQLMNGTASAGSAVTWSRGDHVHPVDTSRYAASNPSGFQTAAQVTATLNAGLGNYLPLAGGTVSGNLTVGGAASVDDQLTVVNGVAVIQQGSAANPLLYFTVGGVTRSALYFNVAASQTIVADLVSGLDLVLDPAVGFTYNGGGNAYKAGGGAWGVTSDERIKTVAGDYAAGLAEVLALRPVTFTYKGNDTPTASPDRVGADGGTLMRASGAAPYPASPHYRVASDATPFVGLVAQEVEAIFPGMVTSRAGFIDGEPVSDLRDVDTSELIFALVNAVKTLSVRVENLEAMVIPR
jgi:hypothetical protein